MATQFKHIDFPAAQALSRAPTAALVAINQAFGGTPEQTLDEVADQPQPLDLAAWDAALAKAEAAIAARDAHWAAHIEPLLVEGQVQLGARPDWDSYKPLCANAQRAACRLASLTPPNANGLILAIRLLAETAALDIAGDVPPDAGDVADAIKRHAGAILEGAVVRNPFMGGALALWQRRLAGVEETRAEQRLYETEVYNPAVERYEQARARLDAGAPQETVQADLDTLDAVEEHDGMLARAYCDALDQLYRAPAPSPTELAVKLQFMADEQDWVRCDQRLAEVLASDARRFGRLGAFRQQDDDLLSAFAVCRRGTEEWLAAGPDLDDQSVDETGTEIDAAEERIFAARAMTIEGVLAKLRLAFKGNVGQAWSDRAIADTSHVAFRDGLASSDWYTRLVWGAIDDLAKLGGVDLASMGADSGPNIPPAVTRAASVEPSAAGVARLSGKNGAGLRDILNERNAELGRLGEPDLTDEERNVVCGRMNAIEGRLFDTPSATTDDVMAKLLLIAQTVEEGFEPHQEFAMKVLAEARQMGLAEATAAWVEAA